MIMTSDQAQAIFDIWMSECSHYIDMGGYPYDMCICRVSIPKQKNPKCCLNRCPIMQDLYKHPCHENRGLAESEWIG